jgi:hypothetical protein
MPHCKNTNFFSEIDVFFKNSEDSAIQAMITALKAIRMQAISAPRREPGSVFQFANCIGHSMSHAVRTSVRGEKDELL